MSQFNWPIIGHQNIQEFLQTSIVNHKLAHAYLFHGPQNIGKASLAQYFVMSIMCLQDGAHQTVPCGTCVHCQQIKKKIHPDVAWYEREEGKQEISIQQIRCIINQLSVTSFLGSYKVGVILGADTMSLAAANSLLKTLEEPSKKTILILTAHSTQHIPKTILSRCLNIKFLPVPHQIIYTYLLNQKIDRSLADALARNSLGLPGQAINLSKIKSNWLNIRQNSQDLIRLINASIKDKINFANNTLSSKNNQQDNRHILTNLLYNWQKILRDLILLKNKKNDKIISTWLIDDLTNISQKIKLTNLQNSLEKIEYSHHLINQNVNPKIILENFLLHI